MLIYLLQRVWFNGGFKREYCSVKILEYSIWIFKVAVKDFGGTGGVGRAGEPWQWHLSEDTWQLDKASAPQ